MCPIAAARYCGQLDRYDDTTGYHVTYDDGDEETVGKVDQRDDIRFFLTNDEDNQPVRKVDRSDNLVGNDDPENDVPRDKMSANEIPASELARAMHRIRDVDDREKVPIQGTAQNGSGQWSTRGSSGYLQTEGEGAREGKFRVHSCSSRRDLSSEGQIQQHQQQLPPELDEQFEQVVVRLGSSIKQQSNQPETFATRMVAPAPTAAREEQEHVHFCRAGEVVEPNLEGYTHNTDIGARECHNPSRTTQHDSQSENYHSDVNDLAAASYREIEYAPSSVQHPTSIERRRRSNVDKNTDRGSTTADENLPRYGSTGSSDSDKYDRGEGFGAYDSFVSEEREGEISFSTDSTEWTRLKGPELLGLESGSESAGWAGVLGDGQVRFKGDTPREKSRALEEWKVWG